MTEENISQANTNEASEQAGEATMTPVGEILHASGSAQANLLLGLQAVAPGEHIETGEYPVDPAAPLTGSSALLCPRQHPR